MSTLYEQLGGKPAVDAAVDIFYTKVLADEALIPFFSHTDMNVQRAKQKAFLTYAFGGAKGYNGPRRRFQTSTGTEKHPSLQRLQLPKTTIPN